MSIREFFWNFYCTCLTNAMREKCSLRILIFYIQYLYMLYSTQEAFDKIIKYLDILSTS